ncbi:MAG: hypothetical protein ACK4YD_06050 [Chitinophagia bacterium]
MKRILLIIISFALVVATKAQTVKGKNFGVQFTLHDYKTASEFKNIGASAVFTAKQWKKLSRMRPGIAITYSEGLNEHFDFNGRVGFSYLEYSLTNQPFAASNGSKPYFEADANINMKMTSDDKLLSPYLSLGVGAANWNGYYSSYIPAGAGLQLNLFNQTYFVAQAQYRIPVTSNASGNLFYSIGILGNIGK